MSPQVQATTTLPRRALVLLLVLTIVWGTNWPLFKLAVAEVSVWTFRAVGVALAGAALLLIARLQGRNLRIAREHWPMLGLATLCYLVVWNVASAYSATMIPSGQSAVLGFTMPLWSALIGWLVLGQRLSRRMLIALALGAAAVVLLVVPALGRFAAAPLGLALGLLSGIGWAVGTLILKSKPVPVDPLVLTAWQLLASAVPITLGALAFGDHRWFLPSPTSMAVILYIALVPMAIGNWCWFAIVGMLPSNVAGLSAILVPVVAMISGAWIHGEPLGPTQWLAMACSVGALSLALWRPSTR